MKTSGIKKSSTQYFIFNLMYEADFKFQIGNFFWKLKLTKYTNEFISICIALTGHLGPLLSNLSPFLSISCYPFPFSNLVGLPPAPPLSIWFLAWLFSVFLLTFIILYPWLFYCYPFFPGDLPTVSVALL